jgi:BNR repeat-like domain
VVLPDGALVNSYSRVFEDPATHVFKTETAVVRSTDRGVTWSAPVKVADIQTVGAKDPDAGTPIRTGVEFSLFDSDSRGNLYAAWEDARFTNGQRDGVALSRSTDGGRTWSQPTAVNRDLSTQAFPAGLAVRRDGTVGVAYYDLRNNTASKDTLPTDYWLATSNDGGNTWAEKHVAGPFDLNVAPKVDRPVPSLYLGDYQGLVASGLGFVPFFAMTDNERNRTDIVTGTVYPAW